ncbi:type II secretion system F family protein [Thioalkalivibrio thiocyanodenitrificans]|uniref:type II secretion system F family protein n=1 Tax=Thioalkalivibrio thiocyanodenitrificans TaxID=243063 RepID=UPI00036AB849|nr:type II secretion system F family protein [Thioalkalivibrio thiocyanodenitrificans]
MEPLGNLIALLDELMTNPEAAQIGFAAMMGLAAFTLMVAMMLLLAGLADPLRRRLQHLEQDEGEKRTGSIMMRLFAPVGDYLVPTERENRSRAALRLRHAGIRSPTALRAFYGAKLALAALLPLVVLGVVTTFFRVSVTATLLFAISAALGGYLLPTLWLERAIRRRTRALRRGLADALDLLVVCSEAGLGLGQGIQRVAEDLEVSHPELSDELLLFNMQTRAGMDNREALRDLEERTGVEDIRGLVTTLLQSMRFGTSIAATLRIFAAEMRDKRTQEAEEKAAKVSTKMLFPLVFCVFPSFFVVALGPPMLGAMAALGAR